MAEQRIYTPDEVEALEARIRELEGALRRTWMQIDGTNAFDSTGYIRWCEICKAETVGREVALEDHAPGCIVRTIEG